MTSNLRYALACLERVRHTHLIVLCLRARSISQSCITYGEEEYLPPVSLAAAGLSLAYVADYGALHVAFALSSSVDYAQRPRPPSVDSTLPVSS